MKWIALIGFILLLIPATIWPWSREIIFLCQMLVGIVAVYLWSFAWSLKSGKSPTKALFMFALGVIFVWGLTFYFPAVYVGRTTVFGISLGAFHFHQFLDHGQQAEAMATSAFASGPIAPYANPPEMSALGRWGVLRLFVFSLGSPLVMDVKYLWEFAYLRIRLPMWTLVVLSIVPGVMISIANRLRARRNYRLCKRCSYDLLSNTSGICPECGTPIPEETREKLKAETQT